MTYQQLPVEQDPAKIAAQLIATVSEATGTTLTEAHPVTVMLEAVAMAVADMNYRSSKRADSFFDEFGEDIVGLARKRDAFATLEITVTAVEPSNLSAIPIGTVFEANGVRFELVEGGQTTGKWALVALVPGLEANGLSPTKLVAVDKPWTITCTTPSPSEGGLLAEEPAVYRDRLADTLTRMVSTAVTPDDFARIALTVPGVAKAVALNRKKPDALSKNSLGHITVVLAGPDGRAVSEQVKAEVRTRVEAVRALSLVVHLTDPTVVNVQVKVWAKRRDGFGADEATSEVQADVAKVLKPGVWDKDGQTTLHAFQIARLIEDLDSVLTLHDIRLNGQQSRIPIVTAETLAPTINPTVEVVWE
ncbi:baseplate J/gp47 family protein [Stomatohabitans albus]|uniref:baseplate J/gp47 family protein n=1 Tax=Stomatohabitans albus TaxID=3110766 RepID=UPI00300D0300